MQQHHHWPLAPKALICNSHAIICSNVCLPLLPLHAGPRLHSNVLPLSVKEGLVASHGNSMCTAMGMMGTSDTAVTT